METHKKLSVIDIQRQFSTQEKCINFLEKVRWEGRPECPRCKNQHMNYYISSTRRHKCSKCTYQFNVLSGSIFQSTKLKLPIWFVAIYHFTTKRRGLSSCELAGMLGIEQRNAWYMLMRLRIATNEVNQILQGILEIDETYIHPDPGANKRLQNAKKAHEAKMNKLYGYSKKRKTSIRKKIRKGPDAEKRLKEFNKQQLDLSKRGKRIPFNPAEAVLGMYERKGRVKFIHLGKQYLNTRKEKIENHVKESVCNESIVITDQSEFYRNMAENFEEHHKVNHDKHFVSVKGVHTNGIENVWNHLKRMISGTYFHMSPGHLQKYLDEHAYRWSTLKQSRWHQFEGLFDNVFQKGFTFQTITNASKLAA